MRNAGYNASMLACAKLVLALATLSLGFSASTLHSAEISTSTWQAILGPADGTIPKPSPTAVIWRDDFTSALQEARTRDLPMFVTWRCIPCKQCADFDKGVLDGSPHLTPLLQRFVTVRMTDAAELDERFFPYRQFQDLDLSWWGYFLSPQGRLYGVFGGKDHVSDATRISEQALVNTMRRVLAHHYDPRHASWKVDGPLPTPDAPARRPRDMDHYEAFEKDRPWMAKQTCLHCHQVGNLLHFDSMKKGTFDLTVYTQPWPLPENVGIVIDRDDGLLVMAVDPDSPAAVAGIRAGDRLGVAGKRRLFGQADFRGVLHRASYGADEIPIGWTRNGKAHFSKLVVRAGWRKAENSWRKTVYEGIYGPHLGFFPIKGPNQGKGAMSFRPYMGSPEKQNDNPWHPTGLRPHMEIVEVDGRSDDWDSRQFLAWFRLNHEVGDKVTIKVRGGQTFSRTIPAEH